MTQKNISNPPVSKEYPESFELAKNSIDLSTNY